MRACRSSGYGHTVRGYSQGVKPTTGFSAHFASQLGASVEMSWTASQSGGAINLVAVSQLRSPVSTSTPTNCFATASLLQPPVL